MNARRCILILGVHQLAWHTKCDQAKLKLGQITSIRLNLINSKIPTILHHCCYVYSCTSLLILLFLKSTVYCPAHFIAHLVLPYFFYLYLCIFSCVVLHILHCPLSGPDLIYISPLIIFCRIEYVTNKSLNPLGRFSEAFLIFISISELYRFDQN